MGNFNRKGDVLQIEIRDSSYKIVFRGAYNLSSEKELLNLLGLIEKFSSRTIRSILNAQKEWF